MALSPEPPMSMDSVIGPLVVGEAPGFAPEARAAVEMVLAVIRTNCTARGRDCKGRLVISGKFQGTILPCLRLPGREACFSGYVMPIQSLPDESLDQGLTTDIEFCGGIVEFVQHGGGKIDVHPLNRSLEGRHPAARSGKKMGYVLAFVGKLRDLFGGDGFRAAMRALVIHLVKYNSYTIF